MDPDRDLLDIIVAHSTEAVCLVGADGSIVFVNARLCGLSGYEPGELPGRPSADLFPDLALPSASAVAVA
ncbi:diguanylate cyclase, partial [bacterium CG17_big_fil_post_rev_8_21_14_2_50_64_8]